MTGSLEQATAKLLLEAQSLFGLPSLRPFDEALATFARLDPALALETLLRQSLSGGADTDLETEAEPIIQSGLQEPRSVAFQRPPGIDAKPPLRNPVVARRLPIPVRPPAHKTSPPVDRGTGAIPAPPIWPPRKASPDLPSTEPAAAVSGLPEAEPLHSRPAGPMHTQLVTGLADLQHLFHSVVTHSHAATSPEDRTPVPGPGREAGPALPPPFPAAAPARPEGAETLAAPQRRTAAASSPEALHPVPRSTATPLPAQHPGASPGTISTGPAPAQGPRQEFPSVMADLRLDQPPPALPKVRVLEPQPSPSAAVEQVLSRGGEPLMAPLARIQDPAWEEVLLDRLLDRFEERLREQSIRHLGFTGGQI